MSQPDRVAIHYHRPPDRTTVFDQEVVRRGAEAVVTYLPSAEIPRPMRIAGEVALDPGAPVVWFTFPGRWHDIGRFHRMDGTFTGYYANVLTPVEMEGARWDTTDLFLDVWWDGLDPAVVLDEAELEEAVENRWVSGELAARAAREAEAIIAAERGGTWPPCVAREWTLDRVCRTLSRSP